jgi:hypothetical protein
MMFWVPKIRKIYWPPELTPKNLIDPGIEPGPLDLQPGTLTTRPQRPLYIYKPKN